VPSTSLLRDETGKTVLQLEKMDISRLVGDRLEAADADPGEGSPAALAISTDCCIGRPISIPSKKYPIINNIYPGPQTGSVGSRQFSAARGDTQAIAELGFVVVQIDGMGTPWRSKRFHAAYYGNMGDNTLPDQVAGMKELASRYPWIDIDRAGIYGHSGGGFATASAMFRYPDFFKVGVSQAGNHDNRVYEDDWAEKWQGPAREERRRHHRTTTTRPTSWSRISSKASCCSRTARWTTTCRSTTRCWSSTR
jgi:hypothetical protein